MLFNLVKQQEQLLVLQHVQTISLLFLLNTNILVKAHTFIYAGCSQDKYQPSSPYETNLNTLLSYIVSSSSRSQYNGYALGKDDPAGTVYGLYQCRGDLKTRDCATCIASAVSQIGLACPGTYGATLQLDTCFVRYERLDFLGKLDTTITYKKCSKSSSSDSSFSKQRDEVLADLLQGAMGFKVSRSGLVQGYAQCLGDLSPTDCSSCLSDAVDGLKGSCGAEAAAGDMFLAQCYARYWASGYYDSDESSNDDDVGKTVAIIVGVVAGVAVVIVFLSFCRKALG